MKWNGPKYMQGSDQQGFAPSAPYNKSMLNLFISNATSWTFDKVYIWLATNNIFPFFLIDLFDGT